MLAVHELEEILIGDLTWFDITTNDKEKIGHEAVEKVISNFLVNISILYLLSKIEIYHIFKG